MNGAIERRRRYPRIQRRVRVHYGPPGVELKRHASIAVDVSERGLYVQAMRAERPGTRLDLDVDLPGGEVSLQGIVVWSKEASRLTRYGHGGFGVWLLDPPEAWRRAMSEALSAGRHADAPRNPTGGPLGRRR